MRDLRDIVRKMRSKWHSDLRRTEVLAESILSYCQNQVAGEAAKNTDMYHYIKEVHDLTKPHDVVSADIQKVRVGREQDGGYVMIKPYSREKIAYSIGIEKDVSWDFMMAEAGYQIFQYDHTIRKLPMKNKAFHWKKLGLTGGVETERLKHLQTIINDNGHSGLQGMVLKADIEGYEWDMINNTHKDILAQFDQITLEIHDLLNKEAFDKHLAALRKLSETFAVIHIHPNNVSPIYFCGDLLLGNTLEITYVKKDAYKLEVSKCSLPTLLDNPNVGVADNMLGRW